MINLFNCVKLQGCPQRMRIVVLKSYRRQKKSHPISPLTVSVKKVKRFLSFQYCDVLKTNKIFGVNFDKLKSERKKGEYNLEISSRIRDNFCFKVNYYVE